MSRKAAFQAGFENPLIGASEPLQRLYGTVQAIGEELGGADMGTPVGTRFRERQKQSKAEAKRLADLREKFPEEFGRGQMMAQEQADPYMLGLGTMPFGMRPGVAQGQRVVTGPGGRPMLAGPEMLEGEIMPPRAGYLNAPPPAPFYRSVPPEMGTSTRPMTPFQQNQVGLATGRFGPQGYAPEMAVTDFESYGPMGARPTPGPFAPSGFDRNMLEAFRAGRANYGRNVRPEPMGGGFTLEEMGQAVAPYRQGGLVYEPVSGGAPGVPGPAMGRGMRPMMMEGEFREVPGLGYGGYGGGMDFGVTREGMAMSPTGGVFGPAMKGAAAGLAGYGAGQALDQFGGQAASPQAAASEGRLVGLPPIDVYGRRAATALSGAPVEAPAAFSGPVQQPAAPVQPVTKRVAGKKAGTPKPPSRPEELRAETPFDPNLNYLVTQALDRLLGGSEAERGRMAQQYYERQGYY